MSPGRRVLAALGASAWLALAAPAWAEEEEGCVACHLDETQDAPVRQPALLSSGDAHARAGLGCTACHGGRDRTMDYLEAHDRAQGFRGKIPPAEVAGTCAGCHDDAARMKDLSKSPDGPLVGQGGRFRESVHGRVDPVSGFELPTCVSCHGAHGIRPPADPESPVHPTRVPDTCARCHGDLAYMRAFTSARVRVDQLVEYRTSLHGRRLAEGDTKVAVCSSCHGSHDIRRGSDPTSSVHPTRIADVCGKCHSDPETMAGYEVATRGGGTRPLPVNQLAEYRDSVHHEVLVEKGDASAPTCATCHGNHGATPPEVRSVAHVCGLCHSRPAELYAPSPLRKELDALGWPGCATCHGNHRIGRADDALLARIAEGNTPSGWEPGDRWRGVLRGFADDIRRLDARLRAVESRVEEVEDYGMDLTRARLDLTQARDGLVRARVTIHAFDPAKVAEVVHGGPGEPGGLALADRVEAQAEEALEERSVRRIGLAVALGIIALLVAALLLRIRQLG